MAKNEKNEPKSTEEQTALTAETVENAEGQKSKSKAKAEEESTVGLVKMHKHGEYLHVHPTTVEAHKEKGWSVA